MFAPRWLVHVAVRPSVPGRREGGYLPIGRGSPRRAGVYGGLVPTTAPATRPARRATGRLAGRAVLAAAGVLPLVGLAAVTAPDTSPHLALPAALATVAVG